MSNEILSLSIKADFSRLERALLDMSKELAGKTAATAVSRTAARARLDMRDKLQHVFRDPTPFTVNSIRFSADVPNREATLYISEDGAKGTSPAKYLRAEIMGGQRRDKRSERALIDRGMMEPGQQIVPGKGARLDSYGNIPGARIVKILSALSAFGEQGYSANISQARRRKLRKLGMAVKKTGTDYFIGRDKDGRPRAVYHLVGPGDVRPELYFVDRRTTYKPRFDFTGMAHEIFADKWPKEMRRAFYEAMESMGLKAK